MLLLQSLTPDCFYPCCGQDLGVPIRLFASAVSDFYFVDTRKPRRPDIHDVARLKASDRPIDHADAFVHLASGRDFRLHRKQDRAEAVLNALPKLGVFFFRGDNPVDGEGSSGILWLGGDLFSQVLKLLIPCGLVVTDGSKPGPHGPKPLSGFYHDRNIGHRAMEKAVPFEYQGRRFTCIGYAGEKNGPTLIWQVA